jgi:two-component system OmpR family response regulator
MKLLVIEDNPRLAERIKERLSKRHLVDVTNTGEDGLQRVRIGNYAVIILDLGLPDLHGSVVCKKIRKSGVHTPILILTGVDDVKSRVELLNSGADDYLSKPFNSEELAARVAALGRRQERQYASSTLKIHDLVLDTQQRTVERAGTPISLRRKEFDILEYLVNNKGRVLTREMILNHAWDSSKNSWSSTVDVHIKHLRDKIDRPFDYPLIKTAYGVGYRIDAPESQA